MPHSHDFPHRPLPRISELGGDLLKLSPWQVARTLALPFVFCGAYWVLAIYDQWILAALSLVCLSFVTYGSTSHDLVHGNLGLNRGQNDWLLSVIEAISLRSGHAYQVAHLNHHARFPHDDDIESEASRMSLARTLLEGVIFQARIYRWALRNPRGRYWWIVWEGVIVALLVLGSIAALPWTMIPAVYVVLMIAGSWIIPLITSYLPHNPNAADVLHQTRLFRGPLVRIVAFDHLYHLEHHLYPAVPHQNWHRLAQRLDPFLEAEGVEPVRVGF